MPENTLACCAGDLMDALVLKLTITPALIAAATLVGRRFGPIVSGWLVGLPLTSAPVVFFVALAHGKAFAAQVAFGILLGTIAQSFCLLAYAHVAARESRTNWFGSLVAGTVAFVCGACLLQRIALPLLPTFAFVVAVVAITLFLMPRVHAPRARDERPSAWDLPARMLVATALVTGLSELSGAIGPRWTGLLSPFPVYGTILAVFAHRESGGAGAVEVMRGLETGMFSFAIFFTIVGLSIVHSGLLVAFASATAATLVVQAFALIWLTRNSVRA
ncbi:MAG TPA: hypothetical protein VMD07_08230 [Candidatus Acidoferrales bacterium]|nr:hypothetical protein [Candidatus Acidoferrales bacterium]